jgi:hypothetical protein
VQTNENCGASIKEDFSVVGEGGFLAQASLLSRGHNEMETFGRALYSVFEAKKFAQGVRSVGTATSLSVLHQDGRHNLISTKGREALEKLYEQCGPKEIPEFEVPPEYLSKLKTMSEGLSS